LLNPYIPRMKTELGPLLDLDIKDLGIKAKTHEALGPIGRGEAIAAWAVALGGRE